MIILDGSLLTLIAARHLSNIPKVHLARTLDKRNLLPLKYIFADV